MSFCLPGCQFPPGNEQLGLPDESPPGHSRQSPDLETVPELEEDVSLLVRYSDECLPVEKPSRGGRVEVSPLEKLFNEAEANQRMAYRAAEFVQDLIRQTAEGIAMEAIEKAEAEARAEAKAKAEAEAMAILEAKEKEKQKVELANFAAEFVQDLLHQTAERIAMEAFEKAEAEARAEAKAKAEAEAMAILEAKEKEKQKVELANVAAGFVQDLIRQTAERIAMEAIEKAEAKARAEAKAKAEAEAMAILEAKEKDQQKVEIANVAAIEDAEAEIKAEGEEDVTAEDVYTEVDVAVADAQLPVKDEVHDVPVVEEDMGGEEKLNLFCKDFVSEVLSGVRDQLFEEGLNTFADEVVTFNLLSAEENVMQDLMREELFCKTLATEVISAAVSKALHKVELESQSRIDDSLKENIEAQTLEDEESFFCKEYVICRARDRLQKGLNIFSSDLVEETLSKAVKDLQGCHDKDRVTGQEYNEREDLFCQEHVADVLSCSKDQLEDERLSIFALDLVNETLHRALQKDPLERDKSKCPSEQEVDESCTQVSVTSSCLKSHVSSSLSGPKRVTFSETTIEHRNSSTSIRLEKELRRARSSSVRLQRARHREHMLGLEEVFKNSAIQNQLAGRKVKKRSSIGDLARGIARAASRPFRRRRPRTRKESLDPGGTTLSNPKVQGTTAGYKVGSERMESSSKDPGGSQRGTAVELHGDSEVTNQKAETKPKPLKRTRTRRFLDQVARSLTEIGRPFVACMRA